MGRGVILEQGTHDELLQKDGAYARLVEAQRLRESTSSKDVAEDAEDAEHEAAPAVPREDFVPLGRSITSRSLASDILQRRRAEDDVDVKDYSIFHLLRRMLPIARPQWHRYAFGALAAIGKFFQQLIF